MPLAPDRWGRAECDIRPVEPPLSGWKQDDRWRSHHFTVLAYDLYPDCPRRPETGLQRERSDIRANIAAWGLEALVGSQHVC
ncbi:MAG: hypothetical protein ACOC0P_05670 [Planctomycetota bacterium]